MIARWDRLVRPSESKFWLSTGFTDGIAEREKKYGTRIENFHKPNGGQASEFNFGFDKIRDEIIAFLDADNYWLPGKLSTVVSTCF